MYCNNCGKETSGKFCANCGVPLTGEALPTEEENTSKDFVAEINGESVNISEMVRVNQANQKKTANPTIDALNATVSVNKQLEDKYGINASQARQITNKYTKITFPRGSVDNSVARCPKCRSTSIQPMKKGFGLGKAVVGGALLGPVGLLAGGIGKNKVEMYCMKCGNKWKG